jgi:golgi to ER traffic protein 4
VLGTRDSPARLATLEHSFYTSDAVHTAASWAGRAVLPYLLVGNVRGANQSLLLFNSKLGNDASLGVENISSASADVRVYPSLPLLNFLGLLLLAVQRGTADLFRQLKSRYGGQLREVPEWNEALERIGEMYFGIKVPVQTNPLFDMMAGLLGGGGGGGGASSGQRRVQSPPASGLD